MNSAEARQRATEYVGETFPEVSEDMRSLLIGVYGAGFDAGRASHD